ncbi:hypothetical protein BJ912DRAFT_995563 [Pholiota molesta]|nr:hypothetical protein BJ912DRAFT_995563 [Pholiota molesta]
MAPTVRVLEHPTDLQINAAVGVLLRAMHGDPAVDSMTGGNETLREPFFRAMTRATAVGGSIYVVSDADGSDSDILSVGMWFGPGQKALTTESQMKEGWMDFYSALTPQAREWWEVVYQSNHEDKVDALLGLKYVDGWFANLIATDPIHQRKGYGSTMVTAVCQRAAKEGKIAALATQNEKNAKWYTSLGFKVLDQVEMSAPTGAWPDYFLVWEGEDAAAT